METEQKFPFRKRFRSDNDDESDEYPQDFLSESDSEESIIDVAHELEDIITDIYISFTNIVNYNLEEEEEQESEEN